PLASPPPPPPLPLMLAPSLEPPALTPLPPTPPLPPSLPPPPSLQLLVPLESSVEAAAEARAADAGTVAAGLPAAAPPPPAPPPPSLAASADPPPPPPSGAGGGGAAGGGGGTEAVGAGGAVCGLRPPASASPPPASPPGPAAAAASAPIPAAASAVVGGAAAPDGGLSAEAARAAAAAAARRARRSGEEGQRPVAGWGDGAIRCHARGGGGGGCAPLWLIPGAHSLAHSSGATAMRLSNSGTFLVSGGMGGELRVWDMRSREMAAPRMKPHSARVVGVAVMADDVHVVGYSRSAVYPLPPHVRAFFLKPTLLYLYGLELAELRRVAAEVRAVRPPNPYTGNGVQYLDEAIKLKQRAGAK
ncbi:50S ribosomal protein L6, partial [Tetrabaena socialis]